MALIYPISTGEQTVIATGPVTGTLVTTATLNTGFIKIRLRGLTAGQSIRVAVEDTNSVTAFTDALAVFVVDTPQGVNPDGNTYSKPFYEMPELRIGTANSKLRLNVTAITATTSVSVEGWVEQ